MCTVSYIPNANDAGFVLTSNRDEKSFRPTVVPQIYTIGKLKVGFPKDVQAGGSWIAANGNGRLCCLLNGAFVAHEKKPPYTQSRGTVLLELISSESDASDFFQEKDLLGIEPFTMITLEQHEATVRHFSELIWDGTSKHFRKLNPEESYIWSSVTLYGDEHRHLRKQWFDRFLQEHSGDLSPENILKFHSGSHTGDHSINVIMEREGGLKTVSITQLVPENGKFRMKYHDLHKLENTEIEI